jgi:hypothetical protein
VFEDATPDGSHAVLSSTVALTETPIPSREALYAWSAQASPAQQLQLVSLLPAAQGGLPARAPLLGYRKLDTRNAVSSDGSRVVWEAAPLGPGEEENGTPIGLYTRDVQREETVQLDAAEPGCGECESGAGRFQLASSTGSKVLFTDTRRLTSDAPVKGSTGAEELYECQIVTGAGGKDECHLTDLTATGGENADVLESLPGASEDAQWVYFVANGVLTSAPDGQGEKAKPGHCEKEVQTPPPPGATCNLYLLHDGHIRLVSVLAGEDGHDWAPSLASLPARVSPNGQWLEFMSQGSPTGYDNRDTATGGPDAEVYLYSAAADHVFCASCEPSGARPTGIEYHKLEPGSGGLAGGPVGTWLDKGLVAASVPGWTGNKKAGTATLHQPNYLTNEGRLYFNSADGLVPQDVNGTEDVYQYEPPGIGNCGTESPTYAEHSGGCVGLISSGASSQESAFLDASASSGDVFFLTSAPLVKGDKDVARDVYDAHVCSSESPCPSSEAATPPPCETGDACKPAPAPQPEIFGAPASALFSGPGNVPPAAVHTVVKKTLTRAQKLAAALKVCKRDRPAKKRAVCVKQARKQFGPIKSKKKG